MTPIMPNVVLLGVVTPSVAAPALKKKKKLNEPIIVIIEEKLLDTNK
jgi:hypothetical protein